MRLSANRLASLVVAAGLCASSASWADDNDALALQSDETADKPAATKPLRLAAEAGVGHLQPSMDGLRRDGRRLSLDLRWTVPLDHAWKLRISNRTDHVVPANGGPETVNSLREAALGWQSADGSTLVDAGRISLRLGPALGYSPTDFLRTGGLRTVTTADPVALREQRQGTFMLRYSRLWSDGGMSLLLAPRLKGSSDSDTWGLDAGSTNRADRAIATLSRKWSDALSGQVLLQLERGQAPRIGATASSLLSDALVVYGEVATGRPATVLSGLQTAAPSRRQQAVIGATYTFPSRWAVTLEGQHNGAGMDRADWDALAARGPVAVQAVLLAAQRNQEITARNAWLLHVGKTGLAGIQALDAKAFLRHNASDGSRLAWAELRYHWPRVDGVLQWQRSSGDQRSEFGAMPYRQVVQLIGAFYW